MASKKYKEMQANRKDHVGSDMPKHKQLIQMLSFRVVPAYYKEIEKVADKKDMTVSELAELQHELQYGNKKGE